MGANSHNVHKVVLNVTLLFLLSLNYSKAQSNQLAGRVLDASDSTPVAEATIKLVSPADSLLLKGTSSDSIGLFQFNNIQPTTYLLEVSFIGYDNYKQLVTVMSDTALPTFFLSSNDKLLKEVEISAEAIRVEIKGDTIQYNANAFKVHPDATAEDLLKKMPGVTTDGNTVKVNGEEVKKILVDGKPFFSDDPSATLKNLPADMVNNVQVFDQQSDQSQFTGFRDGNEQKTINLNTKKGMNVGQFGKLYAGYGTDNKYDAGFTYNSFRGSRRISLIGMSNNINQQNFSISDIMSVMSNSGNTQRMGPPGSGSADFFTGQQNGITKTNAFGLNYSDNWGKKIKVSGSYFFNYTDNSSISSILRNYYTQDKMQYNQSSKSQTLNTNHKVNFKLEYFIDTLNKLTIAPRLTYQSNTGSNSLDGNTITDGEGLLSNIINSTGTEALAYNFNNDLLYQHKFAKKGRTISFNLNTQYNKSSKIGNYYSTNTYNDTTIGDQYLDQYYNGEGLSTTLGGNLSYTEPLGKKGQLLISYKPSYTKSDETKNVFDANPSGGYTLTNSFLSNTFDNSYNTQRGGINYSLNNTNSNFTIGSDIQQANLEGNQVYPDSLHVSKTFLNLLPTASFNKSLSRTGNFNVTYRTSIKAPAISQLQNIIDQSNSQFIRSGNPQLSQSYENNITVRFMKRMPEKERHFMVFLRATQTNNYIGGSTNILRSDTIVQGVTIKQGSQLITPVNLHNYYNINGFGVYGLPVRFIKSNLTFNAGYNLSNTPTLINDRLNYALSSSYSSGFYLGSNISPYLDFSLNYKGSYNTVSNTLQTQSNSTYFSHSVSLKANYILLKKIVLGTDFNRYYYTGLSSGFNQTFSLWSASIGYKFLKNQSLQVKFYAYDILNQNTSISRSTTETYTEDSQTQVLNRYFMLSLTYTFRHFKNGSIGPDEMKLPKGLPSPENMPFPPRN